MKKSVSKDELSKWRFEAILKKGKIFKKDIVLSTLVANDDGECNDVKTNPGSRRCGLATALMEFCFTDPDVGSLNPETSMYVLIG